MKSIKDIHTTIDKETWLLAQINDIRWSEALRTGISVILGTTENEEDLLIEKINRTSGELNYLQQKLNRLRTEKDKQNEKKASEELKRIIKEDQAFKRINPLRFD